MATPGCEQDRPRGKSKREPKHWLEFAIFAFVVATAFATGAAAWYTREQWLTAADIEKRQLRAYINFQGGEVDLPSPENYIGAVSMKNWGVTPAYHAVSWINADVRELPLRTELSISDPEDIWSDVGPGAQFGMSHVTQVMLAAGDLSAIRLGSKAIYVWGTVRYKDVFGMPHRTDFYLRSGSEAKPNQWQLRTIKSYAD